MTKHTTPKFLSFFSIVFLIPKNYSIGVIKLFNTALVQPLRTNPYLSSMKNSFLPQFNIQPILSNHTYRI